MKRLFFLLFAIGLISQLNAQSVDLRLNLDQGKTYTSKTISEANVVQTVMGQQMNIEMTITSGMSFTVTNKTADFYELDVQYTSMIMDMKMPQANMTFSSENAGSDDPVSGLLAKMKESPFKLKMTPKGKVLEVKDLDKLMDALFANMEGMPDMQKAQMRQQIEQSFGQEAVGNNLGSMLGYFPEGKVKPGDSWTSSQEIMTGMAGDFDVTYTYKGQEGGFYLIHSEGKITPKEDSEFMESNGMQVKSELGGIMSADVKVAQKTGWIEGGTGVVNMEGKTIVKANEQMPEDMELPMKIDVKMTYYTE